MPIPYFYMEQVANTSGLLTLDEPTSKHVVQVLRMQPGEKIQLTDGKGNLYLAEIAAVHKKSAEVKINSVNFQPPAATRLTIAISLLKNASRFEWFLEKATEIGVGEIIPLLCERTEKHHFRLDRMKGILVSAMLQSQQPWLPLLSEPVAFSKLFSNIQHTVKLVAHCDEGDKHAITEFDPGQDTVILIGPEGDFTPNEIDLAIQHHFIPVTLGNTRLRTETAGMVAATLLKIK